MEKAGTFIEVGFTCLHLNVISVNVTGKHDVGLGREIIIYIDGSFFSLSHAIP